MVEEKPCLLFRRPEGLGMGKGIGYCDVDGGSTTCERDVTFCERPEALEKYLKSRIEAMAKE
jgi:hypothetical protein